VNQNYSHDLIAIILDVKSLNGKILLTNILRSIRNKLKHRVLKLRNLLGILRRKSLSLEFFLLLE
jgi:hypothetical protein